MQWLQPASWESSMRIFCSQVFLLWCGSKCFNHAMRTTTVHASVQCIDIKRWFDDDSIIAQLLLNLWIFHMTNQANECYLLVLHLLSLVFAQANTNNQSAAVSASCLFAVICQKKHFKKGKFLVPAKRAIILQQTMVFPQANGATKQMLSAQACMNSLFTFHTMIGCVNQEFTRMTHVTCLTR